MDTCIQSLIDCGDNREIIIVNDGSVDDTLEKAQSWQQRYPDFVKVIDKPNGGHGSAVNSGLAHAEGLYFKVVDSDDWLNPNAMVEVMAYLNRQLERQKPTDLVVMNYVYDKVHEHTSTTMHYRNVFPQDSEFTWGQIGHFGQSHYLLMHSVIYRTSLLKDINLQLPEHCFYVDNIFVYVPLPQVKTLYYIDCDAYHYFIGREDQSVNESIMLSRIDQQLRITKIMIDSVDIYNEVSERKLQRYMESYLAMMMCICSVFLRMDDTPEMEAKRKDIWDYLKNKDEKLYKNVRYRFINFAVNIPTSAGRQIGMTGYHAVQKVFKFN